MSTFPPEPIQPGQLSLDDYDRLAWEYYQTLPLEHFMESTPQATQREITVASMALLKRRIPELQYFSELLVQYLHRGRVRRVVPDNMLVRGGEDVGERRSYPVEREEAPPLMMFEYVSSSSEAKDYGIETDNEDSSFTKYEQHLQTPYYLIYDPATRDLRIFHLESGEYVPMERDTQGRVRVPELDLEIGIHDNWVRFWHRGELLAIPVELEQQMEAAMQQVNQLTDTVDSLNHKNALLSTAKETLEKEKTTLSERTEVLAKEKDTLAKEKDAALQQALGHLRDLVEVLAYAAGRNDILQNVAAADQLQLQQWLAELQ